MERARRPRVTVGITSDGDVLADGWLAERARGGDVAAYEVLVRRHRDRIRGIALQVLGNTADADDVTQDVVIGLWTARSGYDGAAAFTTWLHRVVVNRCLNHRRAQRPTGELTELLHPVARGPEDSVVAGEHVAAGLRAIAALPDELRVPLVLVHLEGLSYRQAAAVTGLSEATLRGRLARARARLTAEMTPWAVEELAVAG